MKLSNWIQLILLVGLLFLGFYSSCAEKKKLEVCSKDGTGIVLDVHTRRKRGYFIKYSYSFNGDIFKNTESISKEQFDNFSIGDTISIKISCSHPDVSELNYQ